MDVVDEVFEIDGEYVLAVGNPAEVCTSCGERSFSIETAEVVRKAVNGEPDPARSIKMRVFEFGSTDKSVPATPPLRNARRG